MTQVERITRSKDDLKRELIDQLQLLRSDCINFDNGLETSGKRIAGSLRLLLNQKPTPKQGKSSRYSRALLDQLGYRNGYFLSSATGLIKGNLLTESPLLVMRLSTTGMEYLPLVHTDGSPSLMKPMPFPAWWAQDILKDNKGRLMCRRVLVEHVANTDGGAHVDAELDSAYMALSRENSLNWNFSNGKTTGAPSGRPELACMRQIAHELLCTIERYVPEFALHAKSVQSLRA